MTRNLGAAIALATGLVLAAIMRGGIYESSSTNPIFLWRTNRFTGAVTMCISKQGDAAPVCSDAKSN